MRPWLRPFTALLVSAAVVIGFLLGQWNQPVSVAGVLAAVAVGALLSMSYRPKEHVRARFRQFGDRVEVAVVLAIVPVVIGEFGVYSRLLATF